VDYSKLSDFEINKLVVKSKWPELVTYEQFGKVRVQVVDNDDFYFDFNNPNDAWPIIIDNEISLICQHCKWTATDMSGPAKYWNENPLRAAMIVYLMMKGVRC
jgi:hypothetical protein